MRLGVSAALVGGEMVPGDVEVAGGVVRALGVGGGGRGIAVPGFVDLQVNGCGGVDLLGADAAGYARAGGALRAQGTTAYLPTFITAPEGDLVAALRGMPDATPGGPRVLGAHLEGPFLAPGRRGAHPAEHLRAPDPRLLSRLLDPGRIARMTLAPELRGALDLVDVLLARGVAVSAGHSEATAAEAHAAFDRGVSAVTHLHNAMAPGTHREPGLATAALARDDVAITLIADGHHLAPDTIRVAWRAAAGRLALITDAVGDRLAGRHLVAGTGGGEGVEGIEVVGAGGAVGVAGVPRGLSPPRTPDGRLAGSRGTMIEAVRLLHALGAPLPAALQAASTVPARLAGRPDLGRLAPGAPADIAILDDDLEVVRTLVAGRDD